MTVSHSYSVRALAGALVATAMCTRPAPVYAQTSPSADAATAKTPQPAAPAPAPEPAEAEADTTDTTDAKDARPDAISPEDQAALRAILREALQEYGAGNYQEAYALFRRAHTLQPSARTLRGMGKALFNMKHYVEAIRDLHAALEDDRRSLDAPMRKEVNALIERAGRFVGRFALDLYPRSARVLVNGRPGVIQDDTLLLDHGLNQIAVRAGGYEPVARQLQVVGGDEGTLAVRLERGANDFALDDEAPPPVDLSGIREGVAAATAEAKRGPDPAPEPPTNRPAGHGSWLPWSLLIASAATAVTAVVLREVANAEADQIRDDCPVGVCSAAQLSKKVDDGNIEDLNLAKNVALGAAAGLAVASALVFFVEAGGPPEPADPSTADQASLRLEARMFALDGAGLELRGAY